MPLVNHEGMRMAAFGPRIPVRRVRIIRVQVVMGMDQILRIVGGPDNQAKQGSEDAQGGQDEEGGARLRLLLSEDAGNAATAAVSDGSPMRPSTVEAPSQRCLRRRGPRAPARSWSGHRLRALEPGLEVADARATFAVRIILIEPAQRCEAMNALSDAPARPSSTKDRGRSPYVPQWPIAKGPPESDPLKSAMKPKG
ncbi:MAG: hypothetical protein KKA37_10320 [Alphaproteobacteria bacterium]|jgi:hypothetical protein|nr:hypothetical protein [Alphaproteobacteria bacterium]MBU2396179.1 hypothetical protein [Alphaproteobacteria bacterium]